MRNLSDKEVVELLDGFDRGDDEERAHSDAEAMLMAFLRGNGFAKVADAYEAARDRVGFWYA